MTSMGRFDRLPPTHQCCTRMRYTMYTPKMAFSIGGQCKRDAFPSRVYVNARGCSAQEVCRETVATSVVHRLPVQYFTTLRARSERVESGSRVYAKLLFDPKDVMDGLCCLPHVSSTKSSRNSPHVPTEPLCAVDSVWPPPSRGH